MVDNHNKNSLSFGGSSLPPPCIYEFLQFVAIGVGT